MKKFILSLFLIVSLLITVNDFASADVNNVILETCTGTWCQYCPCGHSIIDAILSYYPNTLVLEYHGGGGGDPFITTQTNTMISNFGFTGFPTGVVGRTSGILDRSQWLGKVNQQSNYAPGVRIQWSKTYTPGTNSIVVNFSATALTTLTGDYYLQYVMLEDNVVYPQTGNSGCPAPSPYTHKHIVRDMPNGTTGDLLNTGGTWASGVTYTKTLNYTINAAWVAANCEFGAFVYKSGPLTTGAAVQQTKKENATLNSTGINNINSVPEKYTLEQNYPNPFNPTTNIHFSIPKSSHVTFQIYDVLGNLVDTYCDQNLNAGTYNVEFNGANLSSGTYFYTLKTNDYSETKRMMLVK